LQGLKLEETPEELKKKEEITAQWESLCKLVKVLPFIFLLLVGKTLILVQAECWMNLTKSVCYRKY
jgi:hypothetical protein